MHANKTIHAGVLSIGYAETGSVDGAPVFLMHGFPYDIQTYAEVAPILADAGCRVIVPYMRGFGSTRFLDDNMPRSGEQAAFGADLLALMDALNIQQATLAGYDWGGRAACVVAALWPERCTGLVSLHSYNIQNIADSLIPASPEKEQRLWYQFYLHSERGRAGLEQDRQAFIRHLWKEWSPTWNFNDVTFAQSAASFDNPDFVEVVIHSYKHRYGLVEGDPAYATIEQRLAAQPVISVPSITFDGTDDGVRSPSSPAAHSHRFSGPRSHRVVPGVGHNMPQEVPDVFAQAVLELVHSKP